jgi:Domain of unknown function (DUF4827)
MKRISYLIIIAFCSSIILSSCANTTYATELQNEQTLIADYINRNNINVLSSVPANNIWGVNDYVLTASGLYFHLTSSGDTAVTVQLSNEIVPRFKQYTLNAVSDTISNWSTVDSNGYPEDFIYGDYTQMCTAFHEAVSYMKHNNSEAKIIVYSKIGFKENWNPATPMGYQLKIKIKQ